MVTYCRQTHLTGIGAIYLGIGAKLGYTGLACYNLRRQDRKRDKQRPRARARGGATGREGKRGRSRRMDSGVGSREVGYNLLDLL